MHSSLTSTFLVFGLAVATCFVPSSLLFFVLPAFLLANLFRPQTFFLISAAFSDSLVASSLPVFVLHVTHSVSVDLPTGPQKMAFHSRTEVDFPIFTRTWPPTCAPRIYRCTRTQTDTHRRKQTHADTHADAHR